MEFNADNKVVKLCFQGMGLKESGATEEAAKIFLKAWNISTHELEKFISAHFLACSQLNNVDRLKWFESALSIALKIDNDTIRSALPHLYGHIAKCYEDLNDPAQAKRNHDLGAAVDVRPTDKGPFYHGTKADLSVGDFLNAGGTSNYKSDLKMNHIYFTSLVPGAGLAADLAKGDSSARVYVVEPTGPFENDPNVTNNRFPGNPTLSYRSEAPLKIIAEVKDWKQLTPEELAKWHKRLDANKGEIIN